MEVDRNYLILEGGRPLNGKVRVPGAKNAFSKQMVAALLTTDECVLRNVPQVSDLFIMTDLLRSFGVNVEKIQNGNGYKDPSAIEISARELKQPPLEVIDEFADKSRIPVLLWAPMLHRLGSVTAPGLGGCNIGSRPIDFHIDLLTQMGATVEEEAGNLILRTKRLKGANIRLPYPSVGATEQGINGGVLADGVTEIKNAAMEPEIFDLIRALQKMGAIIYTDTDRTITIEGVDELNGYTHTVMPDPIEAASWACLAAGIEGSQIEVENARQDDLSYFLMMYRKIGGSFDITDKSIIFYRQGDLEPTAFRTDVHPGFRTDWQQPFVTLLTQARGLSIAHETVYEERLGYTKTLNEMGADIQLYRNCLEGPECRFRKGNLWHSAGIKGPTPLKGMEMTVPDLRGAFAYVEAALMANGRSKIRQISKADRGYQNFVPNLEGLGGQIIEYRAA